MYQIVVARFIRFFIFAGLFLVLSACGQGSGPEPVAGTPQPVQTGVLIDSPVSGVSWESSSGSSGVTNEAGEFSYLPLETITFSIGGVTLGTVEGAPIVTIVELTNSVVPTSQAAVNMLIFLQSIDSDGDPTNGITVSASGASAASSLSLDFFADDFATRAPAVIQAIAGPDAMVVSEGQALNHFYSTYASMGGTDTFSFTFPGYPPVGGGADTFELKFADEFDQGDAPDPTKWNLETGYGPNNSGWGNNEWQLYTNSPDNVRVEDGNLVIQARCDTPPCGSRDGSITSARINTLNKFNFKFGKVVARIKPPVGTGAWPAFWALGANFPDIGWPRAGEIDFMEMHNAFSDEFTTHSTIHWCDQTIQAPQTCSFPDGWIFFTQNRSFPNSLGDDFQVWEAEWDEDGITMSMNGVNYFFRAIEPDTMEEFLEEFFMILNVAMGGTLGSNNQPPSGNEVWPQTMLVDYVRVFQKTGGTTSASQVIDFEDDPETYNFGESGGFGGGAAAVVPNPVSEGINTSSQVGRMLKFEGEVFAGSLLELADPIVVPANSSFTMKVWSPRPVPVLFKLEGATESERSVMHSGSGWEELTFDFGSFAGTVEGISLIFDLGVVGDAGGDPDNWTFYFDDIVFNPTSGGGGPGVGGGDSFPLDFEDAAESYNFGVDGGFGGGASAVVPNPVSDGINPSAQVARMFKFSGEVFAGSLLELPSAFDVVSGSSFTMKVWSPREVNVLFKLEGDTDAEIEVRHGGTGWETLTYDFGSYAGSVSGLTFIFDLGIVGDATNDPDNWTFYFDDIEYIAGDSGGGDPGGGDDEFGGDFEDASSSYDFGAEGGFGGGAAEVLDNPVPGGINTSAQVARMLKFQGEPFAGSTWTLPTALDVMEGSQFTMQVWSPREVMVLLKLEGPNEVEINLPHGGTGWEELTYDFSAFSGSVEGFTLIFDLGTVGDAMGDPDNWTFYFDNITLVPPGSGGPGGGGLAQISLPITFDDAGVDYSVVDFGSPVAVMTSLVADPDDADNTVASTTKPPGAPVWGGTTMSTTDGLAEAIPFTVNETTIGVRVYSPDAGIPVRLKADDVVNGTVSVETEVLTTVANEWETLIFDFANPVADTPALDVNTSYRALSIFFNFGTSGDEAGSKTYLWDDVEFDPQPPADTTAPSLTSVSVTSNNADTSFASVGDTVTVTLIADEPIATPNVTIAGSSADSVTGAGAEWQATRTLTANDAEGPISFAIGYMDIAGNAGVAVTQTSDATVVTLDATAPLLAITGLAQTLNALDPVTLTFQFTENVSGFELGDLAVVNGEASALSSTDAATYTAVITPAAEGELSVNVAAAAAQDAAGNASASADATSLVDTIAPAVMIEGVPADFATLDPIAVTFQFSEVVDGFDLMDVAVTNGTVDGFTVVDGDTYAATVTPSGGGDLVVAIAAGAATDAAGNMSMAAADATALIDAVAPTVAISGVPADFDTLTPISVTFTFSEAVAGFELADIQVTNGAASNFAAVDAMVYTADVTPDGAGDLAVAVAADAAQDGVGNASVAASEAVALVDAVAPSVTISAAPSEFVALDPIGLTFQFSEAVNGFTVDDITVTNGAASAFVVVDDSTYTANVTPNGNGDLSILVAAGAAQDAVGNASVASAEVVVINNLDTEAPLLTLISIVSNNAANTAYATTGDVVTVSLTANEEIVEPVVTINGQAADTVTGSGADWQATRTLQAGETEGAVTFTLDFADLDGNDGPQSTVTTDSSSVTFDVTAPTLTINGLPATFDMLDPLDATFQFSEDVSGFDLADIAVTNGAASGFVTVDASTYTAVITPDGNGGMTVAVAAGAAQDLAGLQSEMPADVTVANDVDVEAPTLISVSIESDNANTAFAAVGDTVTVTFTADEEIGQPTVTLGGAAATVSGSGVSYTASRTLLASDTEGAVVFTIDFADLVGNDGMQVVATTDATTVTFDQTDPTLTITGLSATFTSLDPIAVTFTFSEDVNGFEIGDIMVTNGVADAVVMVDGATYTANVTPDGLGDLIVAVAADAASDLAGNTSTAASETATGDLPPAWELVWSDSFDGAALDAANWTARTDIDCPAPCDGVQSYNTNNVTVAGGAMTIEASDAGGSNFVSGFIDSRGKRELKYGRIEVDAILPGTQGTAPALMLLPVSDVYGAWPLSGEIDLAKAPDLDVGGNAAIEQALVYGLPTPETTTTSGSYDSPAAPTSTSITYAMEWEEGEIRWFVDDVHVLTQSDDNWYSYSEGDDGVYEVGTGAAPFDEDFYLALTVAVSESTDGTSSFPQSLVVDEVRVFECARAIDPVAGTGCSTGDVSVTPVSAPSEPFSVDFDAYVDGPTTVGFIDEMMVSTSGTLVATTQTSDGSVSVLSNANATDPEGGTLWSLSYTAPAGVGDAVIQPGVFSGSDAFFNLTGGGTAGELLFRLRVNSATGSPTLSVGLDDAAGGSGQSQISYTADGTWQQYSVKIADVVTDSVSNATALDLANVVNLFRLSVAGGSATLDIDDITVKVACRETDGCEVTPSLTEVPLVVRYQEDFEGFDVADNMSSIEVNEWLYFNAVFTSGNFLFQYFGSAPNGPQISAITTGQGGIEQGDRQLSVYNDYECCGGGAGHNDPNGTVEANVFREETLTAADEGKTLRFSFNVKRGNIEGSSTAFAFLKVLDPDSGFSVTGIDEIEMTNTSEDWVFVELELTIEDWQGQLLQFGFRTVAGGFEGSGVFYDNLLVTEE